MKKLLTLLAMTAAAGVYAGSFDHYVSTAQTQWAKASGVKDRPLPKSLKNAPRPDASNPIVTFNRWGTTFNEKDWDALSRLTQEQQDEIMQRTFSPDGELRFSLGRISMNANDYALDWYSCSDVPGDFDLKYFNIERDKNTIIPYIHAAQKQNPDMHFWVSPWSPPAWMKINNHYAVRSGWGNDLDPKLDRLVFGDGSHEENYDDDNAYPRRLPLHDYLIQDPRYLQCYADMFSRFIDLYAEQGVNIGMVMYQNEAYAYSTYPGCSWTADGILRFNLEYLAPTLQSNHPEVELCIGTLNTYNYDHITTLLNDPRTPQNIKGIGFQWDGGRALPRIHKEYPDYRYISTESECGNGNMDWDGAEHTFGLINHYIGNGCEDYNNWNLILMDRGESRWGWQQNALIRVNSADLSYDYTPEYFAYRHYSQFIGEGSKILDFTPASDGKTPTMTALTPEGKTVVVAGNFNDDPRDIAVVLPSGRCLSTTLQPHSMHSFVER